MCFAAFVGARASMDTLQPSSATLVRTPLAPSAGPSTNQPFNTHQAAHALASFAGGGDPEGGQRGSSTGEQSAPPSNGNALLGLPMLRGITSDGSRAQSGGGVGHLLLGPPRPGGLAGGDNSDDRLSGGVQHTRLGLPTPFDDGQGMGPRDDYSMEDEDAEEVAMEEDPIVAALAACNGAGSSQPPAGSGVTAQHAAPVGAQYGDLACRLRQLAPLPTERAHGSMAAGVARGSTAAGVARGSMAAGVARGSLHAGLQHGNMAAGLQHGGVAARLQHGSMAAGVTHGTSHPGASQLQPMPSSARLDDGIWQAKYNAEVAAHAVTKQKYQQLLRAVGSSIASADAFVSALRHAACPEQPVELDGASTTAASVATGERISVPGLALADGLVEQRPAIQITRVRYCDGMGEDQLLFDPCDAQVVLGAATDAAGHIKKWLGRVKSGKLTLKGPAYQSFVKKFCWDSLIEGGSMSVAYYNNPRITNKTFVFAKEFVSVVSHVAELLWGLGAEIQLKLGTRLHNSVSVRPAWSLSCGTCLR
jgi:hypothetical protein